MGHLFNRAAHLLGPFGRQSRGGLLELGVSLRGPPGPVTQSPDVPRLNELQDGKHADREEGGQPGNRADLLDDLGNYPEKSLSHELPLSMRLD